MSELKWDLKEMPLSITTLNYFASKVSIGNLGNPDKEGEITLQGVTVDDLYFLGKALELYVSLGSRLEMIESKLNQLVEK